MPACPSESAASGASPHVFAHLLKVRRRSHLPLLYVHVLDSAEMRVHGLHDHIINEALEAMTGISLREFATGLRDDVVIDQARFSKLLELDDGTVQRALAGRLVIPDWGRCVAIARWVCRVH